MPAPPPDTIDGPHKHRPTERVTENGDPLVQKKVKTMVTMSTTTAKVTSTTTKATTLDCSSIEDVAKPTSVPGPQLHHSSCILEAADGSDDNNDTMGMPPLEDIEADDSDDSDDNDKETEPEDDEAELGKSSHTIFENIQLILQITARLMKRWNAPVYAFFRLTPAIVYVEGCKVHIFECAASHCKCKTQFIRHYIDTGDISSTSNLHRHAIHCWGNEAVAAADTTSNAKVVHEASSKKEPNRSITAAFKRVSKGKVTVSTRRQKPGISLVVQA